MYIYIYIYIVCRGFLTPLFYEDPPILPTPPFSNFVYPPLPCCLQPPFPPLLIGAAPPMFSTPVGNPVPTAYSVVLFLWLSE